MNMKRITALLMAVLLCGGAFAACGETQSEVPDGSDSAADTMAEAVTEETTTAPPVTERSESKDNLPEDLRFDGGVFRVYFLNNANNTEYNNVGTDSSGDLVKDAVWERNRKVEERFGITFQFMPSQGTKSADVNPEIRALVLSGVDEIDVISGGAGMTVKNGLYPYMMELSDLEYLDITNPWWYEDAILEMSFDRKNYRFLMGDLALYDYLRCGVTFYNKDMYVNVFPKEDRDQLYQTVLDGKWTYDELMRMSADAYMDLNGSGTPDVGDQFGLMLPKGVNEAVPHLVASCDVVTTERRADGTVDLSAMNNERLIGVIDKMIKLAHQSEGVFICDKGIDAAPVYFNENQTLFYVGRLTAAIGKHLRPMESEFGVLPMPKYDEEQKDYVTYIHTSATFTCVPKTVSADRIPLVDAVLEGWCAEGYRTVITPFIDTAMKLKYSRDSFSGQVIDLVFKGATIDFLELNTVATANIYYKAISTSINKGSNVFSSVYASSIQSAQNTLDEYIRGELKADN